MTRYLAAALCLFLSHPALANDGWGGLTATGLTFSRTEAVAMEREDLKIGPDRISVDYVFRNRTGADVTGEVIFPLPPVPLADLAFSDYSLPQDRGRANLVNFRATVDGRPVEVGIDRIAVVQPANAWEQPAAAQYDAPGRDVTAKLKQYGLPLTVDIEALTQKLAAMTPDQRRILREDGLIDSYDGNPDSPDVYPLWSVVLRYHWTQTFPAGAEVRVHHDYENHPAGGIFTWEDPATADYLQDIVRRYCVDKGTSRAIMKALGDSDSGGTGANYGTALNIAYVLRTANSWAGPIGHFRLTLDKGAPRNVISLCAEGVKKTGPTTFVIEKTDYVPDRDLEILIVRPTHDEPGPRPALTARGRGRGRRGRSADNRPGPASS